MYRDKYMETEIAMTPPPPKRITYLKLKKITFRIKIRLKSSLIIIMKNHRKEGGGAGGNVIKRESKWNMN